jgi:outer membrane receptor protein involved in Fe transport
VSGIHEDASGTNELPTRVLHSAGARVDVPWAPGLRLAVDVRNLFDARVGTYTDASGVHAAAISDVFAYPLPGRSVLFTARWTYERAPRAR